jgi:hypothetical protein
MLPIQMPPRPPAAAPPRPASSMEAMTGIPAAKKSARHGHRRPVKKTTTSPQAHIANVSNAFKPGASHAAKHTGKLSSLTLANALHAMTQKAPAGQAASPQLPDTDQDGY